MTRKIPHINLKDYLAGGNVQRQHFVQTLGHGLENFGFLTVEGHGIDPVLTNQTYHAFKHFFSLDEAIKRKYDVVPGGARGYTPFGRETAKDQTVPDLKEFWHIGPELAPDHPYRCDYPDNVWPRETPDLKSVSMKLFDSFEKCARVLLTALAEFYGLPKGIFAEKIKDGNSVFRVIHYPPVAENTPRNAVRAAAHEDINLITLLSQSEGQGLEILTRAGEWLAVDALEGDIIVDSGDMLSRLTNGTIPATTHRVVNPPGDKNVSRYSMPFFVHPYSRCDLTVMDHFVSPENPAKWPPITAGAFLTQRLQEIGLLKK